MVRLTGKREKFCQGIANGMSQAAAYRDAYDAGKMSDKCIIESASRLVKDRNVSARLAELRESLVNKALWTREQSVQALVSIYQGPDTPSAVQVSAVKELNAMHGYNAPQKLDHTSSDGSMAPTLIKVIAGDRSKD